MSTPWERMTYRLRRNLCPGFVLRLFGENPNVEYASSPTWRTLMGTYQADKPSLSPDDLHQSSGGVGGASTSTGSSRSRSRSPSPSSGRFRQTDDVVPRSAPMAMRERDFVQPGRQKALYARPRGVAFKFQTSQNIYKYALFTLNILIMLIGAAILGLGIWLTLDKTFKHYQNAIFPIPAKEMHIRIGVFILIAYGILTVVVTFLGCCSACASNNTIVIVNIVLLIIVVLGAITIAVLVFLHRIEMKAILKDKLMSIVFNGTFNPKSPLMKSWDVVQRNSSCCGVHNFTDYKTMTFPTSTPQKYVPDSCCKMPSNLTIKTGVACQSEAAAYAMPDATSKPQNLNIKGCFSLIIATSDKIIAYVIGVVMGGCGVEIVAIILSFFMFFNRRKVARLCGAY